MPLSYGFCRRLCREAERCEPILRAMEVYEDTWGRPARVRHALCMDNGMPHCFLTKARGKDCSGSAGTAG